MGYPYFSRYAVLSVKNKKTVVVIISDVNSYITSIPNVIRDIHLKIHLILTQMNILYNYNQCHLCFRIKGDSGGPMVSRVNGFFYIVGVMSWGKDCEEEAFYPGVFTRVALFEEWISPIFSGQLPEGRIITIMVTAFC